MEYVLFALRDSQQSSKTRLGKLRHLDSLFFFLLITALLAFQLLQQRQLKDQLQAHRPDDLLDQLLQERIPQLEREVSELKSVVGEMSAIIHQALHENKQLTLQLGRQLGLPIPSTDAIQEETLDSTVGSEKEGKGNYEVIEFQSNSEEDSEGEECSELSEEGAECATLPQEVISTSKNNNVCTYLQYLSEGKLTITRSSWSRPSSEQFHINNSAYTSKKEFGVGQDLWKVIKEIAKEAGKIFLIIVLIVVVLLLTIHKRRKGRHSRSFGRDLLRKIWPQERKRVKQEKEWLKDPQVLVL